MKLAFLFSSVLVAMGLLMPQGAPADRKVGDQAPDFTLPAAMARLTRCRSSRAIGWSLRGSPRLSLVVERPNATRSVRAGD
jgi:hypothetical protein